MILYPRYPRTQYEYRLEVNITILSPWMRVPAQNKPWNSNKWKGASYILWDLLWLQIEIGLQPMVWFFRCSLLRTATVTECWQPNLYVLYGYVPTILDCIWAYKPWRPARLGSAHFRAKCCISTNFLVIGLFVWNLSYVLLGHGKI